jgi:hypothetical protein
LTLFFIIIIILDIRTLYIRFLLGFIMFGDTTLRKSILETKGAVSAILKGMWEDPFETVQFVLSVLQRKIIQDPNLPRASKSTFFNNYVLEQLTKLYGRIDADVSSNVGVGPEGQVQTVGELVHEFLLGLCTVPGAGICFEDAGWFYGATQQQQRTTKGQQKDGKEGKQGRLKNTVLLRWAGFLRPIEIDLEREALLELFRNCPELVQP